ncbi:hypothetical protein BJX96DRAFT_178711 [Aspergillus floccosus]
MDTVWYFAYGSNLTAETFLEHRGIRPLQAVPVRIPGWTLTFDIYGVPYQEPAFSSISPMSDAIVGPGAPSVHGTAYLVDRADYSSIIASEGGGTAYKEVVLRAQVITTDRGAGTRSIEGEEDEEEERWLSVMSLTRAYAPIIPRCPSQRYKDIICNGAQEAHLPSDYQAFLAALPVYQSRQTAWRMIGAGIFLAIWIPFMTVAEWLTNATSRVDRDGYCPRWVQTAVRFILWAMWLHHDLVHARVFGRGDGLDQNSDEEKILEKGGRGPIHLP